MRLRNRCAGWIVVLTALALAACGELVEPAAPTATPGGGPEPAVAPDSDPRAVEIAQGVLESMGGREAWQATRFVRWNFLDRRHHVWDRHTGDVRIESADWLVLLNVETREGRAWRGGSEVVDPAELERLLDEAHRAWINDSYWMFMPYKLLDPGVTLAYAGESTLPDGRPADRLQLTFAPDAGYTPQNRYEIDVARDSGLVEQWSFYAEATDAEPRFTLPWAGWRRFGRILLATDHGRGAGWEIAVDDELPRSVFTEPGPPTFVEP